MNELRLSIAKVACLLVFVTACYPAGPEGSEAIEIDRHSTDLLPKGQEAEGIIGDFLLRNSRIEALIAGNQNNRRPNFLPVEIAGLAVGDAEPPPGALYDLDRRNGHNDQLTVFRPSGVTGEASYVRILQPGGPN